jgi:hypothetical protein
VTDVNSLLVMELDVTMKVTIGSADVLMMSLMLVVIVSRLQKSRQHSLSITPLPRPLSSVSVMSLQAKQSLLSSPLKTVMSRVRS